MSDITTIYDEYDNPISVELKYTPPCKGRRNPQGAPMEPDDLEEWDLISATDKADECVELTEEQLDQAIEQIKNGE